MVQALLAQAKMGGDQEIDRGDADKGKAPMSSAFIADYSPSDSFKENFITLGMRIKATNQALRDH